MSPLSPAEGRAAACKGSAVTEHVLICSCSITKEVTRPNLTKRQGDVPHLWSNDDSHVATSGTHDPPAGRGVKSWRPRCNLWLRCCRLVLHFTCLPTAQACGLHQHRAPSPNIRRLPRASLLGPRHPHSQAPLLFLDLKKEKTSRTWRFSSRCSRDPRGTREWEGGKWNVLRNTKAVGRPGERSQGVSEPGPALAPPYVSAQ